MRSRASLALKVTESLRATGWEQIEQVHYTVLGEQYILLKGDSYVLPLDTATMLTSHQLEELFKQLPVDKVVAGIVDDDGSVVYYNVYRGIHKPAE